MLFGTCLTPPRKRTLIVVWSIVYQSITCTTQAVCCIAFELSEFIKLTKHYVVLFFAWGWMHWVDESRNLMLFCRIPDCQHRRHQNVFQPLEIGAVFCLRRTPDHQIFPRHEVIISWLRRTVSRSVASYPWRSSKDHPKESREDNVCTNCPSLNCGPQEQLWPLN